MNKSMYHSLILYNFWHAEEIFLFSESEAHEASFQLVAGLTPSEAKRSGYKYKQLPYLYRS